MFSAFSIPSGKIQRLCSSLSPFDHKISELCRKVVALQDSEELRVALDELKAAIHQHVADAKQNLTELAVIVAVADERAKAA